MDLKESYDLHKILRLKVETETPLTANLSFVVLSSLQYGVMKQGVLEFFCSTRDTDKIVECFQQGERSNLGADVLGDLDMAV